MTELREQLEQRQGAFAQRLRWGVGTTFTIGLLLLLASLDLLTWGINLSILYIVPLMIYAQTARSRWFPALGVLMIALTYLKIVVWTPGVLTHPHEAMLHYPTLVSQIVNRTFVVATLGVCTILLDRWRRFQARWENAGTPLTHAPMNSALLGQSFDAMGRTVGVMVAVALAAAIFSADLFTPSQINSPVLYIVPLTIIGMAWRGRVVWMAAGAFIIMAAMGWCLGPPPSLPTTTAASQPVMIFFARPVLSERHILLIRLITNRSLACAVLLLTAWLLQLGARRARSGDRA